MGAGVVVVKIATDPRASVMAEAGVLSALPPGLGPRLLAAATPRQLLTAAAERRVWRDLLALDLPHGGCLVMEHVPGRPATLPIADSALAALVATVVRLHRQRPRRQPALAVPSDPAGLLALLGHYVREVDRRRLIDAGLRRALRSAIRRLEVRTRERLRRQPHRPVMRLCHGDLRPHNVLLSRGRAQLVDFEHAGLGDPALDLAVLVCRTPLSDADELRLLDAYAGQRDEPDLLRRYFTLRPIVGLAGALGGLLDLASVGQDGRQVRGDADDHRRRRWPGVQAELTAALTRVLGEPVDARLPASAPASKPPPGRRRGGRNRQLRIAIDGTTASLKSPLAAALARRLDLPRFDTGTAFRYAALWATHRHLVAQRRADRRRVARHLRGAGLRLLADGTLRVGDHVLEESLNLLVVEEAVASWAAQAEIRAVLAPVFAEALSGPGIVEGRDVGTELLPECRIKLFVDAPQAARGAWLADRVGIAAGEARRLVALRDRVDRERAIAPLRRAAGAKRVEVTPQNLEATAKRLAAWVTKQ